MASRGAGQNPFPGPTCGAAASSGYGATRRVCELRAAVRDIVARVCDRRRVLSARGLRFGCDHVWSQNTSQRCRFCCFVGSHFVVLWFQKCDRFLGSKTAPHFGFGLVSVVVTWKVWPENGPTSARRGSQKRDLGNSLPQHIWAQEAAGSFVASCTRVCVTRPLPESWRTTCSSLAATLRWILSK